MLFVLTKKIFNYNTYKAFVLTYEIYILTKKLLKVSKTNSN